MSHVLKLLWSLLFMGASAQDFTPVTLAIPENPIHSDFSFLKDELKDAQVVMLGEMTHFDGNVFEMKTKIIQYLVEEMGYTTIAFESGVYDVWDAQKKISSGEDVQKALENSLFSVWAGTAEFQPFINFYALNKDKLKLFGFDSQITGVNGIDNLTASLYSYCKENNLKMKLDKDDLALLLESITKSGMFDEEDISYEKFSEALSGLHLQIAKKLITSDDCYWQQIVKSLITLGDDAYHRQDLLSSFNTTASDNVRDKQMAYNLLAYVKTHPNEKIICWGANQHFANDISSISVPVLKDFVPMGSYVKKEMKSKMYSLAAVTASDSIYLQNTWYSTPIQADSFEAFLKSSMAPHLFISSRQPEMNTKMPNRLFSPITFVDATLSELHDGYLYFDRTTPSTMLGRDSESAAISALGRGSREIVMDSQYDLPENTVPLELVTVYGKKTPYQILRKAIESQSLNYPDSHFTSTFHSNVVSTIDGSTVLDLDFIADQYDKGYLSYTDRSAKTLKEVRWNKQSGFEPESLKEFHGLMYNSPIQYAPLLSSRKFKKFDLTLQEVANIEGDEVYIISFSSPRSHSTYTRRVFLSNYSGYIHIRKDDHAIVKLFENWEVTEFPEQFRQGYNLTGEYAKYTGKEYINETTLSEFVKTNGRYYLTHATNTIAGKITDNHNNSLPFELETESQWYNFQTVDPVKIPYKDEEHLFKKIKYSEKAWGEYHKKSLPLQGN